MSEPSAPLPDSGLPHDPALRLACPACTRELILHAAHVGVEGFCPECQVPIIAKPGPSGEIAVYRLDHAPPPPPGHFAAAPPTPHPVASRKRRHGASPVLIGFVAFAMIVAFLAAAAVSLRRSGRLFDFARPERIIPTPVPVASAPMAIAAPGVTSAPPEPVTEEATPPAPAVEPEPPALPKPSDPREARLAAAAERTLRAFLVAERPWEKLTFVLEPEEDLLSILDFQELDPLSPQAPVRELEIRYAEAEKRWISLATLPEKDGSLRTFCLVHRSDDGAAKVDFSLYWQNRSDVLRPFLEGGPKGKPLTVRAELRRLPLETPGSALRFSVAQAFSSFAPVEISVPSTSPIATELAARPGIDTPSPAIVELVWRPGESQPAPTIGRIVQWGIWAPEG